MDAGYIYILINESFIDLIKIGYTSFQTAERAKQLSAHSGVPTPFFVAYEIFVSEGCRKIEKLIHAKLHDFRVNNNREFFRFPLKDAIKVVEEICSAENGLSAQNKYTAMEILPRVKEKFGEDSIKDDISSIRIYQTADRVYFEYTRDDDIAGYLRDQHITRQDLGFIEGEPDELYFFPSDTIMTNVSKMLEFGGIGICNCFSDVFTAEALDKLWDESKRSRP